MTTPEALVATKAHSNGEGWFEAEGPCPGRVVENLSRAKIYTLLAC